MQLQLQTFTALIEAAAAAVQGSARQLVDLTVGSTLRSLLEASASVGLWMQWLILQVLQMTRAATSTGPDLDSWVADFGLTRLPAVAATGSVTFARFTPANPAFVPVGTQVKTADAVLAFDVMQDASNAAWNATRNGYAIPIGQASVTVPVVAEVAGSSGNVQANTVTLISVALIGVDTVTNALAFTNGIDAETDPALRARFQTFINTRSQATLAAVGYAVASVQQGLTWTIQENTTAGGTNVPGNFVVTVDDGTGDPGSLLLAAVQTAIDAVRPVGSTFQVLAPSVVAANISLLVTPAPGCTLAQAVEAVETALTDAVNTGGMGAGFMFGTIYQVALNCPSVAGVEWVTLNGGTFRPGRNAGAGHPRRHDCGVVTWQREIRRILCRDCGLFCRRGGSPTRRRVRRAARRSSTPCWPVSPLSGQRSTRCSATPHRKRASRPQPTCSWT